MSTEDNKELNDNENKRKTTRRGHECKKAAN